MGGDSMMDVAGRLEQLMRERGLNKYALAKRSGVSWNTINNFYSRRTNPNVETLSQLCDGLGISLAQFFDAEGATSSLTSRQQHLLDRWNLLDEREKGIIDELLDIMNRKSN